MLDVIVSNTANLQSNFVLVPKLPGQTLESIARGKCFFFRDIKEERLGRVS